MVSVYPTPYVDYTMAALSFRIRLCYDLVKSLFPDPLVLTDTAELLNLTRDCGFSGSII